MAVFSPPVVLCRIARSPIGRVVVALGVVEERSIPVAVFGCLRCCNYSALFPMAVFRSPVLLKYNANSPLAVLNSPSVLL